jgi:hypothetical protein
VSSTNKKFGRLTIREEVSPDKFLCDCTCGNELVVWRSQLACDVQRHCGLCVPPKTTKPSFYGGHKRYIKTHDGRRRVFATREYYSWSNMIARCGMETHHAFSDYGGRGIRVCERWREPNGQGFKNFLFDMGPRPVDKTLDRKNPQGHYCPDNCQWADWDVQGRNKRIHLWPEGGPEKMPNVDSIREMEARIAEEFELEGMPY